MEKKNTAEEKKKIVMPVPTETLSPIAVKKRYNSLIGVITKEYTKVETSTLKIAYALQEIYSTKMYEGEYKNIYELGAEKFNLAKGTINNFINVVERFALRDENGAILRDKEAEIKEEMKGYTWTKLCMLVSVPEEYLSMFHIGMTCSEIREKKAEVASLISNEAPTNIIDCDAKEIETDGSDEATEAEEPETENEEPENEEPENDDFLKRAFLPFIGCFEVKDLIEQFKSEEFQAHLASEYEKLRLTIPAGTKPQILVGLSYIK